ncbi:MAG: stage V sporulation protein G, partial [Planctomycetota bacterium]
SKGPFVAMPSRKLADRCRRCGGKNALTAAYCSSCGAKLDPNRATRDQHGRAKLHADLAHPVNSACRIELHRAIIKAFSDEMDKSKVEGYLPPSFDDLDDADLLDESYLKELARREAVRARSRDEAQPDGGQVTEQGL